jgi:hypothetical protein
LQKIGEISDSQFKSIMAELRKNGADAKTIAELEAVVKDSTKRNKRLAELVRKGGRVGEIVGRAVVSGRL